MQLPKAVPVRVDLTNLVRCDVRRQEEVVPVRVYNSRGCAVTEGGEGERPAIEAANAGAKKSQYMGGSPPKEDIENCRDEVLVDFFRLFLKMIQKGVKK